MAGSSVKIHALDMMMMNGSERVKAENLKHIIEWYDTAERGEK